MNMTNPTTIILVILQSQEIQDFLLLPLPDLVCDRKANWPLKSTKQFVASETGTKDLMGDSFKLSFESELCLSLLQPASSTSGSCFGTLGAVVLCSDCSKRLRSRP
ncbi:rCG24140 [Rattus norvegicus]|uniref:RCG24140 n=1 Tax=Rattus norvegicus TaxID=10116 RepID=A6KAV6_RAT|nr:rCG24140 [Rattus norvegicus]